MQLTTRLRGQRNPGKVEPSLTARNLHLTNVRLVPASFLLRDRFGASSSSCLSIPDLPVLHYDSKELNVLPRWRSRSHAEQNQCRFRNRHSMSFACVRCFTCDPSVDENMWLDPVADDILPFERYHVSCTLT